MVPQDPTILSPAPEGRLESGEGASQSPEWTTELGCFFHTPLGGTLTAELCRWSRVFWWALLGHSKVTRRTCLRSSSPED